ncbi:hypothetical protein K1T71_003914 [Dendrolimus kikuchii]|uniref:Uncharacterized protein n=1 Tax=Dendrolimus kikuchii TaxID=765133 RepID=A0ACC1D9H2_9NEOP|nr:hypothetical protein K1T71_003914 [Dendrolimus kikuchii]
MFSSLKKLFKWSGTSSTESKTNQNSLILAAFIGILEDVLFWKKMWLSLLFIFLLNIVFFVCVQRQITLIKLTLSIIIVLVIIDAFETWLKYKHRTSCLKSLAEHDGRRLKAVFAEIKEWIKKRMIDLLLLSERNQTKAFLIINIILLVVFFLGHYFSGYTILYCFCMFVCVAQKLVLLLQRLVRCFQYDIESDNEFENLIPKVSEVDLKLLSIESELTNQALDDKQAFESWKPEDMLIEEASDSSENSSSLVTNFSINTINTLEKDVETSDSSEDEYIPLDQPRDTLQLKSTLKVMEPQSTWSSSAYNAIWNLTGAVANIMNSEVDGKRKRVSSIDSSDGFEMVDTNDL